jgi:Domain of unknown function (DUF1844)
MPERARNEDPEPPAGSPAGAAPGVAPQPAEPARGEPQPTDPQPTEAGSDAAAAGDTEAGASQAVPLAALTTPDLVHSFLSLLALKAWEGMGLVPNALTGKTQKNLDDARLAIDAYASVFEVLRSHIDEGPRRDMQNLLTTLRLNFVDKSAG